MIEATPFGTLTDGRTVTRYRLGDPNGFRADILDYGGIMVSLWTPSRAGDFADILLGFDTLEEYLTLSPFFGALIGRYGNRIADGRFDLDGQTHQLPLNNEAGGRSHCLHGGPGGFHSVLWQAQTRETPEADILELALQSPDGDQGFPGNVSVTARYTISQKGELGIEFQATTDAPTPINLTNHNYYNLRGVDGSPVTGHRVHFAATEFTPVDESLIPLGHYAPVTGTPFDFTRMRAIGEQIDNTDPQLERGEGYDHNLVFSREPRREPVLVATVHEPETGRKMEILTTEPGAQFYTGNHLPGDFVGKGGTMIPKRGGFCVETQHPPDGPNQPAFPNTILLPESTYRSRTLIRFSAE